MSEDYDDSGSGSGMDEDQEDQTGKYYSPLGLLAVVIVVVNAFLIILILLNVKLRKKSNALLVSLAIADGTTGLVGIPLLIVAHVLPEKTEIPPSTFCYLGLSIHTWFWFLAVCSIFHLLIIACEQYLAILKPFNHDKIVTKTSVTGTLLTIWAVSIGHAFIPWTWILPLGGEFCEVYDAEAQRRDEIFSVTGIAIFFVFPVAIILYVYYCIVLEAKRHISRIKRESCVSRTSCPEISPCIRFRGFYIIAVMSVVFVLCWAPYFITVLVITFNEDVAFPFSLDYTLTILRFVPSLLNPLMFAFWKSDLRLACVERFFCCAHGPGNMRRDSTKEQMLFLN